MKVAGVLEYAELVWIHSGVVFIVFGVFPGVSVCFAQCMGVGGSIYISVM